MKVEDVAAVAKVSVDAMEDCWNRYERDYYPKKALEFDKSLHTSENYVKRMREDNALLFVTEENGEITYLNTL